MTATQLGSTFGRSARAMNVLLQQHGFLQGEPGAWRLTELGKQFASSVDFDNGYGGLAHRSWGWLSWSDGLVDALKASIEANPDGLVVSIPSAAAKAVVGTEGHVLGKSKWVVAAVGLVGVATPAARKLLSRLNER